MNIEDIPKNTTENSKPEPKDDVRYQTSLANYHNEVLATKEKYLNLIKVALERYGQQNKATVQEFVTAFVAFKQEYAREVNDAKDRHWQAVRPVYEEFAAMDYQKSALSLLKHVRDEDNSLSVDELINIRL